MNKTSRIAVPDSRFRIANKTLPGTMIGCYFLLLRDEVVYIGKSIDIISRISQHAADGKEFDEYTYMLCSMDDLDGLEARLITHFQPRFNKQYLMSKAQPHPGPAVHAFLKPTNTAPGRVSEVKPAGRKLRTKEAATYMALSESTLEKFRHYGGGPRYYKLGRAVIYDSNDIDEWLLLRAREQTWGPTLHSFDHQHSVVPA